MEHLDIKPGIGLGDIKFGMSREQVKAIMGEPDETEQFSYSDTDEDITESWHYDEYELSIGFDEDADWRLMTFAVSSDDYKLQGKKLVGKKQSDLMNALKELKIENLETEDASTPENPNCLYLISEEKSISFWIENGKVSEIQWGPEFLDEDTIRWPD